MVAAIDLGFEVADRIQRGIDGASDLRLYWRELGEDLVERDFADDHQVHVALSVFIAAGERAVDEGLRDSAREWRERRGKKLEDAYGLGDECMDFRVDGMVTIGLVVDLMAGVGALDEADVGESFEFALDGACTGAGFAGDLADVEGLVGATEEKRENAASGLAEEEVA